MTDRVGQQLGNYTIVRKLGEGGFAEVYLGEHIHLGTYAAIKVLHTQLLGGDTDTFRREARTVAHLIHPHIVRVLDFGIEGSTPFLVMDYAPQGTLRQRHPRGTRLPLSTVVEYVGQIAAGLQYAHDKKLIHRDVKPENMLIGQSNDLLLSDFGIALVTQSSRYQGTLEMAGTMAYMSPEQIQGKPRPASDQYALGIVVYEWLTGDRPFHGSLTEIVAQHLAMMPPPLREQLPTIPQAVEEVLMTALAKDPHARYDSVQAFAEALRQGGQEQSLSTYIKLFPITPFPSPTSPTDFPPVPNMIPRFSPTPLISPPTSDNRRSKAFPTASYVINKPLPVPTTMPVLPSQKRRSTRKFILATLALLILILGGFGVYYPIALHNATLLQQATMTAAAPINATARVQATDTASISTYNNAVAANGIMFGFNAQLTRYNRYEKKLNPTNVSGLVQDWIATTGAAIASSPIVASGMVYISSADGKLYAFNAATGKPLWSSAISSATYYADSSPAVVNGIVYIGSVDGKLYAFNATTGNLLWSGNINSAAYYASSSPTVANGIVYIGSVDGKLYAFNASGCGSTSCSPLWTAPTGNTIFSSPSVANGVVYVSSFDGKLYAFNASGCGSTSCSPLWTAPTGNSEGSSPAVANGVVYVGSDDYKLHAFNASGCGSTSCSPLWTAVMGGAVWSSPAVANGVVYVSSRDSKLYAFNASGCGSTSCSPLWTASTGIRISYSSPTVANGVVYVGSEDDKLYAFNASGCGSSSCSPLWTASTGGVIDSSPTVANGVVYIGSDDGKLYAFHIPGISPY